jgi:hypothetical protein
MPGLTCQLGYTNRADRHDWRDFPTNLQEAAFRSWAWQKTGDSAWLTLGSGFNPLLQEERRKSPFKNQANIQTA